ncbi:hypothetical protein [Acinetobacter sp. YH12117]|uniref:hypothetical protein n=1 Tax=Acinetobacter sp. YH12117 TaxID=2601104 RepID=UPI0015D2755F|nr:hypothetical protein [Acinetobacter sp. YH12117]
MLNKLKSVVKKSLKYEKKSTEKEGDSDFKSQIPDMEDAPQAESSTTTYLGTFRFNDSKGGKVKRIK